MKTRVAAVFLALLCAGCPSAPASKPPSTAEVLANHGRPAMEVYREGALAPSGGAGGTIAVAFLAEGGLSLVVHEGDALQIHPIAWLEDGSFEVGFEDLDGDERVDLVMFTPGLAQAFLTPKADAKSTALVPDDAATFSMIGQPTLIDALARARTVPRRGTSREEVCRLIGKVWKSASLRPAATPNFRLLAFEGDGATAWARASKSKTIGEVTDDEAFSIGARCMPEHRAIFACTPNRPSCVADGMILWFEWPDGEMRLSAAAMARSN